MGDRLKIDALERMLAELATFQRLTLLGRLSAVVTHEVNNQLTGVSGYAQLLLGQEQAKPLEKELDKIHTSAMRCQKLISDMRRIGRFADSERELDNINLIIQFLVDLLRHQFIKRSIQVTENYSKDVSPIEVNTPALEQAFLNIIQNSFEALEEKGGNFSITTLKEDGQLVALFEDDGPGLSEDALAHLFTPFFTTKGHLRCPGLGLTAAKSLVEAHNGAIHVTNSPAGGAYVRVSLPCETDTKQTREQESR